MSSQSVLPGAVLLALTFGSALFLSACGTDEPSGEPSEQTREPAGKPGRDAGDREEDSPGPGDESDAGKPGKPQSTPDAGKPTAAIDAAVKPAASEAGTPPPGNGNGAPGATGPDDGDPSKPVVSLPDVPCGPGRGGFGLGTANLKIGGRDVILSYPCDKHEGANVTFLLNLHGTNGNEASKTYIHGYFAAFNLVNSHNLIVAEPKSRASQWGNTGENPAASEDKPHLLEIIDYVYKNFGTRFNLTSTWVSGHSWGAMYAKRFACDETVKDKVRGVIGMSGGSTGVGGRGFGSSGSDLTPTADCADYVAQIHTVGDTDSVKGVPDQTAAATKHGCEAKTPARDLGAMQMVEEWPGCDPGWVHENITMGGHSHTTAINPEVVKHVIEQVKATEKR